MVDYIGLLKKEVVPAEGCTEPVAVAFAVSLAAEQLGADATDVRLKLSANIIKNALGVGDPRDRHGGHRDRCRAWRRGQAVRQAARGAAGLLA